MRLTTTALLFSLAVSATAFGQAPAAPAPAQTSPEIDRALLPAPAQMKAGATVIKWKSDFTYDTLRKGTNRLVCYERPVAPGQPAFSVECTSIANLERVAVSLKTEASTDARNRRAAFEALEKEGKWPKPEFGSIFYNMTGATQEQAQARSHATIAVPGATAQSLGLPDTGTQGGAYIMDAGSSAAHIMMPGH